MNRCRLCVLPSSRPDTFFDESGVCSACLTAAKKGDINWRIRRRVLEDLLERHRNPSGFDCIVASSGGKDSTFQVLKLLELGARPLVVTATTCMLTPVGRANIDNLARFATTMEVTPNARVRALLNRLGLELVGDISWPEHVSIFTTPFRAACELGIPLIFYGENPQAQYGGPPGAEEARTMTRRWVSEFGGFLGLRPADLVGHAGITERDLLDYVPPDEDSVARVGVEAHFLGQYVEWDSWMNAGVAIEAGLETRLPSNANWWEFENLDNAMTGLHDHAMYRKFGYGRLAAQVSVDIRTGRMSREQAMALVHDRDGLFPGHYMGVPVGRVLHRIGVTGEELHATLDRFTNWRLFNGVELARPLLSEFEEA
jgi:N-acetyl sugar amidotransferase